MRKSGSTESAADAAARIEAAVKAGRLSESAAGNLRHWLTRPEYAAYRAELDGMLEAERFDELGSLFFETIPFGTGGRRGTMADLGSATINPRTIAESAHGLAVYLRDFKGQPGGRAVVACDTRNRSQEFSRLVATTLAAHGLSVYCFESHRSTPELSFAVRSLDCDVGVMITASHNPPSDNGFKAYWSSGGQVLSPHDHEIIQRVEAAQEIPAVDFVEAVDEGRIEFLGEDFDRQYIDAVCKLSLSPTRDLPALFTPLHGVGETSVYRVLQQAGFDGVDIFEPQRDPDGNFSNVPDQLPNPERFDVFQPAIEAARKSGAHLVLASDPDADRLGACVRDSDGEFIHLTGNRIGVLLADYILRKRASAGTLSESHYVVETLVTTPLIGAIARSHGVRVIDDLLVGFKYIGETIDREGPERFVFGAEESLGYLAGDYARDKDAAIAALYLAESAAELGGEGCTQVASSDGPEVHPGGASRTLLHRLHELYVEHGYYAEGQQSVVRRGETGQRQIRQLIDRFRSRPPAELAGVSFAQVRDYGEHEVRRLPANEKIESLPEPRDNLLFFESAETGTQIRLAVRPSGTEPKIKFYTFARAACPSPGELAAVKQRTDDQLARFEQDLCRWVEKALAALESESGG